MKAGTMTRNRTEIALLVLMLLTLAVFAPRAGAGMMDEKKMDTMAMEAKMSRSGMLTGIEGHNASGTVTLKSAGNGTVLVLSDIKVDKVPDGRVYLGKAGDQRRGIELGKLEQFTGDVSYAVADGVDPGAYDSVIIWCEKFDVGIGRALLDGGGM